MSRAWQRRESSGLWLPPERRFLLGGARAAAIGASSAGGGGGEPPPDPLTVNGFGMSPGATSSAATSRTVTFNGVAGELCIAIAGVAASRTLEDIDGSWTVVQSQIAHDTNSVIKLRIWRKILSGSQASEAFTITGSAVNHFAAAVIRIGGDFDETTPIDVLTLDTGHASSIDVVCPSATATMNGVLIIRGFVRISTQNNGDSNYPSDTTGLFVRPSDLVTGSAALGAAWHLVAAGATGTANFDDVGTTNRNALPFTLGIRPAA